MRRRSALSSGQEKRCPTKETEARARRSRWRGGPWSWRRLGRTSIGEARDSHQGEEKAHCVTQPKPGEKHSPAGQLHVPIVWLFAGEQLPTEQVSGKGATILMQ